MRGLGLAWLCFFSWSTQATEIVWVKMGAAFQLNAPGQACRTVNSGDLFYLSAELEPGGIAAMRFQNAIEVWPLKNIYKWITFTPAEQSDLKVFRDSKGRFWIDEIVLSERLLKWILRFPSERETCRLPEAVTQVMPTKYQFDLSGVEEGVLYNRSNAVNLKGVMESGSKFDLDLSLTQKFLPWGLE